MHRPPSFLTDPLIRLSGPARAAPAGPVSTSEPHARDRSAGPSVRVLIPDPFDARRPVETPAPLKSSKSSSCP